MKKNLSISTAKAHLKASFVAELEDLQGKEGREYQKVGDQILSEFVKTQKLELDQFHEIEAYLGNLMEDCFYYPEKYLP